MSYGLPCIICGKGLENSSVVRDGAEPNQPNDGLAFTSYGHYGTTAFDPMDGSFIEINICDECLVAAGHKQVVLHCRNKRMVVAREYFKGPLSASERVTIEDDYDTIMPTLVGWQTIDGEYEKWTPGDREESPRLIIETDEIFEIDDVEWVPGAAYVKNPNLPSGF